jgi:hypothetical protein
VQVDVSLSNMGLKLFVKWRQNLVRGKASCVSKEKYKRRIVEGPSSVA